MEEITKEKAQKDVRFVLEMLIEQLKDMLEYLKTH